MNTDSDIAKNIVEREYSNRSVRIQQREPYYASSKCSGSEFFQHLGEVTDTDIFVYAPCTSPFVLPTTFDRCIEKFLEEDNRECDCVSTVSRVKEFLWRDGKAINYDPMHAPNSQDLPDIVALNFGVTVITREDLIKNRNIIGQKPKFVVTSDVESVDIDTELDFYLAQQLYRKQKEGFLI